MYFFSTIDITPGGAFVQYIVTCERCIIPDVMLHAKKNHLGSIRKHGLCKKLLQLVQYVAWVQVRNLTLYLTCTNILQPFYEKQKFVLQDSSNIPDNIKEKLENEQIKLGDDMNLMCLSTCVLIAAPVTADDIRATYVNQFGHFLSQKDIGEWSLLKHNQFNELVVKQWKKTDDIIKYKVEFNDYEVNLFKEHNMKSLEGIYLEDEIIRVKKERKETFILNRCFINFGDMLCQVIQLHNKYVRKTSWLRVCDTNYCGNAVHHAVSNLSLRVT